MSKLVPINLALGILVGIAGIAIGLFIASGDYTDAKMISALIGSILAGHVIGTVATKHGAGGN